MAKTFRFMVPMRELRFVAPSHEPLPFLGRATAPSGAVLSALGDRALPARPGSSSVCSSERNRWLPMHPPCSVEPRISFMKLVAPFRPWKSAPRLSKDCWRKSTNNLALPHEHEMSLHRSDAAAAPLDTSLPSPRPGASPNSISNDPMASVADHRVPVPHGRSGWTLPFARE